MIVKKGYQYLLMILSLFCHISYATTSMPLKDPCESFNRAMFQLNEFMDYYLLKPTAYLYNKIVPKPLAKGLTHFFNNIALFPTVCNDILQGNFYQAMNDTGRFVINTTAGIGGLFDVATPIGLAQNFEDFGLTLAQWGYQDSYYLVLPFIGSTTIRDLMGIPVNYYLSVYPYIHPFWYQSALYLTDVLVKRADLLRYEDFVQQAAIDKYVFMRDAYLQRRQYQMERNRHLSRADIQNNKVEDITHFVVATGS